LPAAGEKKVTKEKKEKKVAVAPKAKKQPTKKAPKKTQGM
jgi:hypothetical protein